MILFLRYGALVYKAGFKFQPLTPTAMEHDGPQALKSPLCAESGSKKQKRKENEHSECFWMLIVEATSDVVHNFHMVEVNKEKHKEIYKDLKMLEKEDLEIRMDFVHFFSPFVDLKSKSRNYSTQKDYKQSEERKRWENFCYDCTYKRENIIKFTAKNPKDITKARFWVIYSC